MRPRDGGGGTRAGFLPLPHAPPPGVGEVPKTSLSYFFKLWDERPPFLLGGPSSCCLYV